MPDNSEIMQYIKKKDRDLAAEGYHGKVIICYQGGKITHVLDHGTKTAKEIHEEMTESAWVGG